MISEHKQRTNHGATDTIERCISQNAAAKLKLRSPPHTLRLSQVSRVDLIYASGKHPHQRLLIRIGSPLSVTDICESELQNLIFTGLEPHGLPCRKTHAQKCEVIPLSLKAIYAQLQKK